MPRVLAIGLLLTYSLGSDLGSCGARKGGARGMEASAHARWFERLLAELNCKLWMGDAARDKTFPLPSDASFAVPS